MSTIISPMIITAHICQIKESADSINTNINYLTNKNINKNTFIKKINIIRNINSKLLSKLTENLALLTKNDIAFINKLDSTLRKDQFWKNINTCFSSFLDSPASLLRNQKKLLSLSIFLQEVGEVQRASYNVLKMDWDYYYRDVDGRFRNYLRDNFWLKQFRTNEQDFYRLTGKQIVNHFKSLPLTEVEKLNMAFWFSYSRIIYQRTWQNYTIDKVLGMRAGDCGETGKLNVYLASELGWEAKPTIIQVGEDRMVENHLLIIAQRKEYSGKYIIDVNNFLAIRPDEDLVKIFKTLSFTRKVYAVDYLNLLDFLNKEIINR